VVSGTAGRLAARSAAAGLALPPELTDRLVVYFDLLTRWNRKINLTSISNPDEAIDRLLLEPVAAASALPNRSRLMDLGSGGGSPAIPLALALSAPLLVMVESRSRKAAFLREAVRELGLTATVEDSRFEDVAQRSDYRGAIQVVSIRAVRLDGAAFSAATAFLSAGGILALFQSAEAAELDFPSAFRHANTAPLPNRSQLTLLEKC
jgi:16S rRNA (guanine527-N7)-methyltransferase